MRRFIFPLLVLLFPALANAQEVALYAPVLHPPVIESPVLPPPPPLFTIPLRKVSAIREVAYAWDGNATVTRSTFVAAVMRRLLYRPSANCFPRLSSSDYSLLFKDVEKDASYGLELCTAMEEGLIRGYSDGTFKPNKAISIAEASKFLAKAFGLASDTTDPSDPWARPFVSALWKKDALPETEDMNRPVTRDELSLILDELRFWQESR